MSNFTELTPELLISAYAQGVFPMGIHGRIGWFSPDPRGILPLDSVHISKTLAQTCRSGRFEIRVDSAFRNVMEACAARPDGTWISTPIIDAYVRLHQVGLAHSVEAWRNNQLAGGLYGVALGGAFFGESMFHHQRDASKVALVALVNRMKERRFTLLDIQYVTPHLERFGATEISREDYLAQLAAAIELDVRFVDD